MDERFNHRMVTLGRQFREKSQSDLSQAVGITQGHLSKIEQGLLTPTEEIQKKIAESLGFRPNFFAQDDRICGMPVSVHPMFRKRSRVGQKKLDYILAGINIRLIHVRRLLDSVDLNVQYQTPELDIDAYGGDIEEIARLVRATWLVPSGPIENLTALIEKAGNVVIQCDFKDADIDGLTLALPDLPPCIFLNADRPADRFRFTLAHELGHLVMHSSPSPTMEEEANLFAAALLMPAPDITHQLIRVDLPQLARLKTVWKVSMAALLMRAKALGTITDNQSTYLWRQMSRLGYRTKEPDELDFEPEKSQIVSSIVGIFFERLQYSVEDLSKVLNFYPEEFDTFFESEKLRLRVFG